MNSHLRYVYWQGCWKLFKAVSLLLEQRHPRTATERERHERLLSIRIRLKRREARACGNYMLSVSPPPQGGVNTVPGGKAGRKEKTR